MNRAWHDLEYRSADGLRLYARSYSGPAPDAATVLCLHGLTRNSADFEDLAPHLARRYRVLAPDFRGRGRSERDPQPERYRPMTYVGDVLALLDAARTERAHLIGTSLGGLVGMLLGATQRPRLASLVLNDVGPEVDPRGMARIRGYAGRLPAPGTWPAAVEQSRLLFGAAWPNLSEARWQALARRGYLEVDGKVIAAADPAIGDALRDAPASTADLWPLWPALRTVPLLVIRGAHSDILSPATVARMRQETPELGVLEVTARGHVPLLDEPECLHAIDAFLGRNTT